MKRVREARGSEPKVGKRAEYNIILRDEAFFAEDRGVHAADPNKKSFFNAKIRTLDLFLAARDRAAQQELSADLAASLVIEHVGLEAQAWVLTQYVGQHWIINHLGDLETVAAAELIASDLGNKHARAKATGYFRRRPDLAIRGLAPIMLSGGKLAPFVRPVVEATLAEHPRLLAIVAPLLDPKTREALGAGKQPALPETASSAIPSELGSDPTPGANGYPKKVAPLPEFVTAAVGSVPVRLRGTTTALPPAAVERLLQAVRYVKGSPAIARAKASCEPKDLAALAWELFQRWQAKDAPTKEGWAFTSLGVLGDDDTARKLTPLIRAWPGESLHARAAVGLGILATIGTDIALMQLHGIGQKLKFKALQEKAREEIAAVAASRGFTAEELADRLVPDFDLAEGGDVLDFGPRKFTISFDESLKPGVKSADGKLLGDLPKPAKSDDPQKAAGATERWKTLKQDAKAVAAGQVLRLELAMCNERRWSLDVFRTFLVQHPLMIHTVRRLVWGTYANGKLQSTFRVAEDGTLANASDDTLTLDGSAAIGIVHRLSLDDRTTGEWGKVFGDYEIIQPFDQLGRSVFAPSTEELKAKAIDRLGETQVRTSRLLGLEASGWRKGAPQDAGWVWEMWRPLGDALIAEFSLDGGVYAGAASLNPATQKIGAIHFHTREDRKAVGIDAISPILFSELVREREALRS